MDSYNNIPNTLKDKKIWLCFNEGIEKSSLSTLEIEQATKRPRDLLGKPHSINGKLYTFNECLESIKEGYNTGLGIVLRNETSGLAVIDYDKCIKEIETNDKYGYIKPVFNDKDTEDRILRDINLLKSYTEISPSGKGIHIYILANTSINTNTPNIEIYTNKFIRVTGNQIYNFDDIEDTTEQLNKIIKWYNLDKEPKETTIIKNNVINRQYNIYKALLDKHFIYKNTYTDKEILDTMFNSKKGRYLTRLYNNDLSDSEFIDYKGKSVNDGVDTSNSGRAFTLIMHLLHFCYGDLDAVKRIFKKSPLCKPEYLEIKYGYNYNLKKYTKDKIDYCFIPSAIYYYKNYTL